MLQVAVALLLAGIQSGDTASGSPKPPTESRVETTRILNRGEVDFWGGGKKRQTHRKSAESHQETVWAEPVRMPDGRFALYVPPVRVLRFLDDPNPITARDYMAWQKERISKLKRAMEVLEQVATDETLPTEKKSTTRRSKPDELAVEPKRVELLYFKNASCPYCDAQDSILEALRISNPEIVVREVTKAKSPELWNKHSITVTPTIVATSGATELATFRGLASLEGLKESIRKASTHVQ